MPHFGYGSRIMRPFTMLALVFFIIVVEIPFLTYICRNGLSSLFSEELLVFMRNWKDIYTGTYSFSFSDFVSGNLVLPYVSAGFIVAVICGKTLGEYLHFKEWLFYANAEETIQNAAARCREFSTYLKAVGHPEFRSIMQPTKDRPEFGSLLRGLLWAVALIPAWPFLILWTRRCRQVLQRYMDGARQSAGLDDETGGSFGGR